MDEQAAAFSYANKSGVLAEEKAKQASKQEKKKKNPNGGFDLEDKRPAKEIFGLKRNFLRDVANAWVLIYFLVPFGANGSLLEEYGCWIENRAVNHA